VSNPCIDDDRDASRALADAKATIDTCMTTIEDLTARVAAMDAQSTK